MPVQLDDADLGLGAVEKTRISRWRCQVLARDADRVGPGLWRLDFREWMIRITAGWEVKEDTGRRVSRIDECWIVRGIRANVEEFRADRARELEAGLGVVEVLDANGRMIRKAWEGRERGRRGVPRRGPPRELFDAARSFRRAY